MLNKICSFLEYNNFYPKLITWNKFISIKDDIVIFYIKNSISKEGKEYLESTKKKFLISKIGRKIFYFTNSKIACQWFDQNKFQNKKIVIIGIKHDCAYLYRLMKHNGNKVRLLKS